MFSTIVIALIGAAFQITTAILKVATAQPADQSANEFVEGHPVNIENAVADLVSIALKINEALHSFGRNVERWFRDLATHLSHDRMMDRMEMEVESLEKRMNKIHEKEVELEKRADEAISTYGNNVQGIMLFHGLGSIYLHLTYTYVGLWISVSTIVLFFFAFMVTYMVTSNKVERMSQLAKDLQRMQNELQNQVSSFGANIESIGVSNRTASLNRHVATLQKATPAETLELFNSNRTKSLNQVAVVAIIYGLTFPMITSYLLYLVGLRSMGLVSLNK